MRHVVICRQSQNSPESCVTLEYNGSTEDGAGWFQVPDASTNFRTAVHQLVARLSIKDDRTAIVTYVEPDSLPAITITQRDAESVAKTPPLAGGETAGLAEYMPDLCIALLAPIRFELPTRTRFEPWAYAERFPSQPGVDSTGRIQFIARQLGDAIFKLFDDVTVNPSNPGLERYKPFSKSLVREEIWIRPSMQLVDWPNLAEVFPLPRPLPVRTPEQLSKKELDDKVARLKRSSARQQTSLGRTFNPKTQSWANPK